MVSLGPGVHRDGDRDLLLTFPVFGTPVAQGSKVHRVINGHVISTESADMKTKHQPAHRLKNWRKTIGMAARVAMAEMVQTEPICDAVVLSARFYVQRPHTHFKKSGGLRKGKPLAKITAPDLSKYIRALEDALTDAGVWKDDSLVCGYRDCGKFWTSEPAGAMVAIWGWEVTP